MPGTRAIAGGGSSPALSATESVVDSNIMLYYLSVAITVAK